MGSKLDVLASVMVAAAIALWSHPAAAESPIVTDLIKKGGEAYKEGRYHDAAAALQKAYDLDPNPNTLFGLAQAERLGGRCPAAVIHYNKLLELLTDLNTAKLVQTNLTLCEKAEPKPVAPPEPPPQPITPSPTPTAPTTIVVRSEHRTDRLALSLFATGTLCLGAGAGLYVASNGSLDDAVDARTIEDHDRLNDRGDRQRAISYVAVGAGVAMVGYAVYRWVRGDDEQPPASVSIVPSSEATTVSVFARW